MTLRETRALWAEAAAVPWLVRWQPLPRPHAVSSMSNWLILFYCCNVPPPASSILLSRFPERVISSEMDKWYSLESPCPERTSLQRASISWTGIGEPRHFFRIFYPYEIDLTRTKMLWPWFSFVFSVEGWCKKKGREIEIQPGWTKLTGFA